MTSKHLASTACCHVHTCAHAHTDTLLPLVKIFFSLSTTDRYLHSRTVTYIAAFITLGSKAQLMEAKKKSSSNSLFYGWGPESRMEEEVKTL